jgi:acyl-CoA-binding protein
MYGLYKQATVGDNTASQPWAVQLEARAKWDSWTAHKGTMGEQAREREDAMCHAREMEDADESGAQARM